MQSLLRFAPSPTGSLHLGGLRTALFNHIVARQLGGKWILRIEDTDRTRLVPGSVDNIRAGLEWAGLDYDYGPGREGPHGPYVQSERLDLYREHSQKLLDSGHAYRCFCTPTRLAETRERLRKAGSNSTYDRACLRLSEEEVARRTRAGERSIIRFKDGSTEFDPAEDRIFGKVRDAQGSLPTDPVLVKSDLFPTYHLASVVDDNDMRVTDVMRGEEWLPSLPLHLQLYAAFGFKRPRFAHIPLLLNPDGSKMSKRNGDVRVEDYIKKGWEPDAVLNWLAIAGWGAPSIEGERFSPSATASATADVYNLQGLIDKFDVTELTHRASILDPTKLTYLNKLHVQHQMAVPEDLDVLAERARDILLPAFPDNPLVNTAYIKRALPALSERIETLNDLPTLAPYLFTDPDLASKAAQTLRRTVSDDIYYRVLESTRTILLDIPADESLTREALKASFKSTQVALGVGFKQVMDSLRHALSGFKAGPAVVDIILILGRDRTLQRIEAAQRV